MIGYSEGNKAYRVYYPSSRKIMVRRDVEFHETSGINEVIIQQDVTEEVSKTPAVLEPEGAQKKESPKRYQNPRLPIPRSPYPKRYKSVSDDADEQAAFAETFMMCSEPSNVEEALNDIDKDKWLEAINAELASLEENDTWTLVPRPEGSNVITNRWVFKKKLKANGQVDKYKARLVARGCGQQAGIDYTETFSPVVKFSSVRAIFSVAAAKNLEVHQFDVKTAFLHGDLEEELYMEQPSGFEKGDFVCLLKKSLYGLKQASRQWNKKVVDFLIKREFQQSTADPCVFINKEKDMYVAIYVDDGLLCGKNESEMSALLDSLNREFDITHSKAEYFVDVQIERSGDKGRVKIHQESYTNEILKRFNHENCLPVATPADPGVKFTKNTESSKDKNVFPYRQAIGSLMYLMITTRPDICYIVGVLSRFLENPKVEHWHGVQRVFKYLKGTVNYGITFDLGSETVLLSAYSDADFAEDLDSRRSTTGWVCFLNSGPISWSSKKQSVTATSTTEAEFIALCSVTKEVIWLRRLLDDLSCKQKDPTTLYCDNQRAITIVNTPESIKSTKHIEVQFFFTCEKQKDGEINVEYISTNNQLADTLTKALANRKFQGFRICYGIC